MDIRSLSILGVARIIGFLALIPRLLSLSSVTGSIGGSRKVKCIMDVAQRKNIPARELYADEFSTRNGI